MVSWVTYVLNRLAKIDPASAARFQERAQSFESEMLQLDDAQMVSIGDAHHVINPDTGCYTDQFAVQFFNLKPGQTKRYFVNKDLWSAANGTAKAGLVLHEVIYRDAVESFGQSDSDSTRYYNYMISSTAMNTITADTYMKILAASGFKNGTVSGSINQCLFSTVHDNLTTCYYWPNPNMGSNVLGVDIPNNEGFLAVISGPGNIKLQNGLSVQVEGDNDKHVVYDSQGNLEVAYLSNDTQIQIGSYSIVGKKQWALILYPDKEVHALRPTQDTLTLNTAIGNLTFDGAQGLAFYENGTIQNGSLTTKTSLNIGQVSINVYTGAIQFDGNGSLVKVSGTDPFSTTLAGNGNQITSATQFFTTGQVQVAVVPGGQSFVDSQGNKVTLKNGFLGKTKSYQATFDSNGHLVNYSELGK